MKLRKVLIKPSKAYDAKIFRYTDGKKEPETAFVFDNTLHWHYAYEMVFVIRGGMTINKLDTSIELTENDVYIINSQEIHSYHITNQNSDIIIINTIPQMASRSIYDKNKAKIFAPITEGEAKNNILKSLYELSLFKDFEEDISAIKIKSILYNITYYLLRNFLDMSINYHRGSDLDDFDCAQNAINYMMNNFKRDISLNEISSYVGMTPAHFSKYFKEKTAVTFSRFLQKIRLESALKDMEYNNITVKSAAENNGFPNVNSFINACKNEYGHTPVEMKNYYEGI